MCFLKSWSNKNHSVNQITSQLTHRFLHSFGFALLIATYTNTQHTA